MQTPKLAIMRGFVGAVTLVFFTFAVLTFAIPTAQATPAIAKGKPCGTCHAGSPPSKANLKKVTPRGRASLASITRKSQGDDVCPPYASLFMSPKSIERLEGERWLAEKTKDQGQ